MQEMQEMRREDTFWNKSKKQLASQLEISLKDGIESHRAKSWLEEHGLNSLKYSHKRHVLIELILKFKNPIVILLIISAGLAWFVHDTQSASLIFAMIVLSVGMDFTQEHRAHKTAESLQQRVAHHVEVMRDGHKRQIPVTHLVPGDIVMLSAGQLVPADGVVLESTSFFIDQSVVTGENYPVEKRTIDSIENVTSFSMGEALHAVFMGSSVVSGYGKILITKTGIETQLGIISGHLEQADPPSEFSLSLNRFSLFIFKLTIFLVFFSLIINLSFHRDWLESVLFALALAVGLTPEFLPIQVSIAFAHAAKRMATRKVIVKRLSSIHDLGNMNVLCTDKTGTLTEARIKVSSHIDMNGTIFDEVLDWAYLNSSHQEGVLNPLDQAILKCN
ncbi:MAG: HAD-IC family P-type ATPase, partial [Caedimonadaceae bacterium]